MYNASSGDALKCVLLRSPTAETWVSRCDNEQIYIAEWLTGWVASPFTWLL
jgi:hypothetical protein